jgi:hypothetical protein
LKAVVHCVSASVISCRDALSWRDTLSSAQAGALRSSAAVKPAATYLQCIIVDSERSRVFQYGISAKRISLNDNLSTIVK